jgi:hypothetical protein
MPDIQTAFKTALTKTLTEWDDDEGTPVPVPSSAQPVSISSVTTQGIPMAKKTFNVTNNVSRVTFDYIKNNPGSTRKEIMTALEYQGFGGGSVSSLIAQMRRNKMIHENGGLHYADIDEYRPIKTLKALQKTNEPAPKRKYEKKATTGIGALLREKLENTPIPMPSQDALDAAAYAMGGHTPADISRARYVSLVRNQSPDDIISNLTVFQARELYDRLKQIFNA